jgi:hypothetical protein
MASLPNHFTTLNMQNENEYIDDYKTLLSFGGHGDSDYENAFEDTFGDDEDGSLDGYDTEEFDELVEDLDFSQVEGQNFKNSFKNVSRKIDRNASVKKPAASKDRVLSRTLKPLKKPIKTQVSALKPQRPTSKQTRRPVSNGKFDTAPVNRRGQTQRNIKNITSPRKMPLTKEFGVKQRATIQGGNKQISNIYVPADKKVIVEGVNKFILNRTPETDMIKNIGYYEGKKLKELILIFNNTTPNPFTIELFNPSAPLDYLYSTGQNLNNQIQVAGGEVAYSDVLFNLVGNPTLVPNAKFTFNGPNMASQKNVPLIYKDKEIDGKQFIQPLNIDLQIDNMQVQNDVVFFDVNKILGRPFVPDGMDVVNYTVLPGMVVVMCWYYTQKSLKKVLYPEARDSKNMIL